MTFARVRFGSIAELSRSQPHHGLSSAEFNWAIRFFICPSPPLIEGLRFLRGRGGGSLKAVSVGVTVLAPLIFEFLEGGVCQHFDFLLLVGQKLTLLRG